MTDSIKNFTDFKLHPQLTQAIEDLNYKQCTPIQERCIPLLLNGQDIAGLAQTGTGKTAAFLIPLIDRTLYSMNPDPENENRAFKDWKPNHFTLILVPTRELVSQVYENLRSLTKHSQITSLYMFGGVGYDEQKEGLKKPFQFIVATPGRLIDLYKEGFVDFKQIRAVVFDEADRMFDMGFQQDVFYILRRIPQDRQLLLFSATLNLNVTQMAYQANSHPVEIDVSRDKVTTENVEDTIVHMGKEEKPKYLLTILKKLNPQQVIIFSNFKNKVPRIAQFLNDNGYPALGISSLMTQNQRNRVIESFKAENKHNIMVATDLAARGLDIKGVDLVINFELPDDAENYVHRIGRTGRAEQSGKAVSFVSDKDVEALVRIEEYLKEKLETMWIEDNEFATDFKPMPADEFRKGSFDGSKSRRPPRDGRPPRREGRDNRGGDRPRGPRPENRRDRPQGERTERQGSRDNRNENRGESRNSGSVHRDRRTGRHQSNEGRPQRDEQQRGSNSRNNNQRQGGKRSNSRRPDYRKTSAPMAAAQKAKSNSIWGRITSSVKKLIGQ